MKLSFTLIFALLLVPFIADAQETISAKELLVKSMNYHDPDRLMMNERVILTLNEPRKDGADRISELTFDPKKDVFRMNRKTGETAMMMSIKAGVPSFELNGSNVISDDDKAKHKLSGARVMLMRNYYHYLWYLPMKLEDPGTIIDSEVTQADFFGKTGYRLRVSYDPAVGEDIWYFYFDTKTYALIGYRFYHDESANDGEYILLEGETAYKNVRLPKSRKWYKHQEDEYLGMDVLDKLQVGK